MIGAMLIIQKKWFKPGVWNVEEFDPDPFMELLDQYGLTSKTIELDEKLDF